MPRSQSRASVCLMHPVSHATILDRLVPDPVGHFPFQIHSANRERSYIKTTHHFPGSSAAPYGVMPAPYWFGSNRHGGTCRWMIDQGNRSAKSTKTCIKLFFNPLDFRMEYI